jgi:23S rRNA U2552 (ribose-2'-O)-methylase RlmE/FtsJ
LINSQPNELNEKSTSNDTDKKRNWINTRTEKLNSRNQMINGILSDEVKPCKSIEEINVVQNDESLNKVVDTIEAEFVHTHNQTQFIDILIVNDHANKKTSEETNIIQKEDAVVFEDILKKSVPN